MKHPLAAALVAVALAGCATHGGVPGFHADAERADTDASLAYIGIATGINAYESQPGVTAEQRAGAEAIKVKAWAALGVVHQAYASGAAIDLKPLQALSQQVSTLGH